MTVRIPPVLEHKTVEADLTIAEVQALQHLGGKLEIFPTGEPGRYKLRAGSHVGFVALPTGRTLTIQPKVSVETLFSLLVKIYDPAQNIFRDNELQNYTTVEALFEFVVRVFTSQAEELIARGLLRNYQPITEDIAAIRGRLQLTKTLRLRPGLYDRHYCTYTRFTPDILENRILNWTAFCLRPYPFIEKRLATSLRRITQALSNVTLDHEARELFTKLEYHRLNESYRPALTLARLILDHLSFSGSTGNETFLAYLVDMNWVFEKYVEMVVRDAGVEWGVTVEPQEEGPLDLASKITIKPDLVFYSRQEPLLIADAKYKLKAHQEDLYQMLAYCHAFNLSNAVLIHPVSEEAPTGTVQVRGVGNVCIRYLSIDLMGSPQQLQNQSNILTSNLNEVLSAIIKTDTLPKILKVV